MHDPGTRMYTILLKGGQEVNAELVFSPTQVASYDFMLPITLNNLPAPSPRPTPMPRTPYASSALGLLGDAKEKPAESGNQSTKQSRKSATIQAAQKTKTTTLAPGSAAGSKGGSKQSDRKTPLEEEEDTQLLPHITPKRRIIATALRQPVELSTNALCFVLPSNYLDKVEKQGAARYSNLLLKVIFCRFLD